LIYGNTNLVIITQLTMEEIITLNEKLNQAKDSLNLPNFEQLKRNDKFESKVRVIRRDLEKKTGAQHVTKAWLKMWEMLTETSLGVNLLTKTVIKAFFNAELPGAFIFAVNQYLKANQKDMEWLISSYWPQNKAGDFIDDQYGLIKANPQRSLVGILNTSKGRFWSNGNLTNPKMPSILAQLSGLVDLYTADGGFDVTGQENLQEVLTIPLIRGEIETGLRSLTPGGSLVLKIFTFFTSEMLSLLTILIRSFQEYYIFKPTTSGPLNSESYFIGVGYHSPNNIHMMNQTPEEILETLSSDELNFLLDRMRDLVNTQILNINQFIQGKPTQMPSYPNVPPLYPQHKISTTL
jgi:23S rRNA U2552 (ribose-2'-O)-methylase RlmE/FtsJ